MTAWSGAELRDGGSTSSDRDYGAYWSRRQAGKTRTGDRSDHYEEKAAAREAAQREIERDRRENDEQERVQLLRPFLVDDPLPADPEEMGAWEMRRDKYLARAEGEELAARISRRY